MWLFVTCTLSSPLVYSDLECAVFAFFGQVHEVGTCSGSIGSSREMIGFEFLESEIRGGTHYFSDSDSLLRIRMLLFSQYLPPLFLDFCCCWCLSEQGTRIVCGRLSRTGMM
jgi:hypothetical protein